MSEHPDIDNPRTERRPSSIPAGLVILVAIAAAVVLLLAPGRGGTEGWANGVAQTEGRALDPIGEADREALARFAEVVAFAKPAVVRIESEAPATAAREAPEMPDVFEQFFGPPPEALPRVAGGSGFIVSADGRILTNAHIVQGGDLTVWLDDRRSFPAELVGLDRTTDVALVDIDADDLPTIPLGDSDDLVVGEWVLAIGSPGVGGGQLEQTVTAGIVSALGRPLQLLSEDLLEDPDTRDIAGYAIENFIQTDAVINPGNSGGPLIDMEGRVVGINSAIASPTGYFLGYGFAVPANLAGGVMEDLARYGEVRRARIGVNVTTVTPEDAEFFGLDEVRGVLVQEATEGGPAAEAGLRQGDVIVALDGEPIDRVGELQQEVAERSPGAEVELSIVRDGREETVSVVLGEAELPPSAPAREPSSPDAVDRLGLALGALTDAERSELGYPAEADGALVLDIAPLGPAYRKGILPGMLIVEVGGEPVSSPADAVALLEQVEPGQVTALVVETPDGAKRLVTLRMPS